MTERRIWEDRELIIGQDLSDFGLSAESGTGDLAIRFGPGVLQGMQAGQTATTSASVVVGAGNLLVQDPTVGPVGRQRCLLLPDHGGRGAASDAASVPLR